MRLVFSNFTYSDVGAVPAGRKNGHPITCVSPDAIAYDTQTQSHLDIDAAMNPDLCADLLAHTGAYFVGADGRLKKDSDWKDV